MGTFFESRAHRLLRERVNGIDLSQFSMLTVGQFERLLAELRVLPKGEVLDVGSGTGRIAAEVAARTGHLVTGLEIDEDMRGQARHLESARVRFQAGDFDTHGFGVQRYAAIYAVDTLYFSKDLPALVMRLARALRPGGRLVFFWTQCAKTEEELSRLVPFETDLGRTLRAQGIDFTALDYSGEERAYWPAYRDALEALAAEFMAEGDAAFLEVARQEAGLFAPLAERGWIARYVYCVTGSG